MARMYTFDDALARRSGSEGGEVQLIDAPLTSASDYYPFGLAMAGRSYSSEKYRFGYQGQFAELDEETGWNSFEAEDVGGCDWKMDRN
jgi:hypothetical protein